MITRSPSRCPHCASTLGQPHNKACPFGHKGELMDTKELKLLAECATPGPWKAADWNNDFCSELHTVEASEPEVLLPGQSSIWPGGLKKIRVAETCEGDRPLADAAYIAAANPAAILALIAAHTAQASRVAELEAEELALHRKLAAEKLRADQGWARYESANTDRNALRLASVDAHAAERLAAPTAPAQPVPEPVVPAGTRLIAVGATFDALMTALDYADRKGYMPDAMQSEWEAFSWVEVPATPIAQPVAAPVVREPLTWVSVDERLPDEDDLVLICGPMPPDVRSKYSHWRDLARFVQGSFLNAYGCTQNSATHWQPLPLPPAPTGASHD